MSVLHFCPQEIPGATKSGKQKTPEWLRNLLGTEEEYPEEDIVPADAFEVEEEIAAEEANSKEIEAADKTGEPGNLEALEN